MLTLKMIDLLVFSIYSTTLGGYTADPNRNDYESRVRTISSLLSESSNSNFKVRVLINGDGYVFFVSVQELDN